MTGADPIVMFSIACFFTFCKHSQKKNTKGGDRAYRRMSSPYFFRGVKGVLFSIAKTARALGVDRHTVIKAIEKGQIDAIELGSRKWIPKKEIERLLMNEK